MLLAEIFIAWHTATAYMIKNHPASPDKAAKYAAITNRMDDIWASMSERQRNAVASVLVGNYKIVDNNILHCQLAGDHLI